MKPIIIVMLAVDVAMFLVVAFAFAFRKPSTDSMRPFHGGRFAIALLIAGMTSAQIGGNHPSATGAMLLQATGLVLIGMAIMSTLFAFRKRRGMPAI